MSAGENTQGKPPTTWDALVREFDTERFASLANAIYFQEDDGLRVNLFIASELSWPDKGLVLRQETQFPEQARKLLLLGLPQVQPGPSGRGWNGIEFVRRSCLSKGLDSGPRPFSLAA
jgi:hypothetical protein